MPFQSNKRDETMTSCELNQIFIGEIASVQNYGAFVRIPGCKQQGLIHKSQVSAARVDDAAEILHRGERIWCKVISIDHDGKVALSMKHVNQGDGRDLDPNGVQRETDERKRKTLVPLKRKVIELEAVLDTTCAKCGTRGHLAADCFVPPDGKKYRLLSEEPEEAEGGARQPEDKTDTASSGKNERRKRSKKSKRRSDGRGGGSGDESDRADGDEERPSSEEHERRRRRKKKRSKESRPREKRSDDGRKRKRAESSSETSSGCRRESKDGRACNEKKSKKCKHSRSKHSD